MIEQSLCATEKHTLPIDNFGSDLLQLHLESPGAKRNGLMVNVLHSVASGPGSNSVLCSLAGDYTCPSLHPGV